jgi:hypothetical protein
MPPDRRTMNEQWLGKDVEGKNSALMLLSRSLQGGTDEHNPEFTSFCLRNRLCVEIIGSQKGDSKYYCDAVWSGRSSIYVRKNLLSPSSGWKWVAFLSKLGIYTQSYGVTSRSPGAISVVRVCTERRQSLFSLEETCWTLCAKWLLRHHIYKL